MVGLASAGLHQIKKVYDVNYRFGEHFKDFINISKVIKLKSVYRLEDELIVEVGEVGDVAPHPPTDYILKLKSVYRLKDKLKVGIEGGSVSYSIALKSEYNLEDRLLFDRLSEGVEYNLDLESSLNLYVDAFIGISRSLCLQISDKYSKGVYLDILNSRELLYDLNITDRYILRGKLESLKSSYYELYKEVKLLLDTNLSMLRSGHSSYKLISKYVVKDKLDLLIQRGYSVEYILRYILEDISKIDKIIGELDRGADARYSLRSSALIELSRGYVSNISDRYVLSEGIRIDIDSVVEEEDEGDLVEKIILKDELVKVGVIDKEYVSICDAFISIKDSVVKVAGSGTLSSDVIDNAVVLDDEVVKIGVIDKVSVSIEEDFIVIEEGVESQV